LNAIRRGVERGGPGAHLGGLPHEHSATGDEREQAGVDQDDGNEHLDERETGTRESHAAMIACTVARASSACCDTDRMNAG
jgi:hypothetical protein